MKDQGSTFREWIETLRKVFPASDAISQNELMFSADSDELILRIRGNPFVVKYLKSIRDADPVPLEFGPYPVMYLVDRLSTEKAEEMRTANRPFLDLRGNAFLSIPGLYLFVAGRNKKTEGKHTLKPRPKGKLFKKSGIQFVTLFLTDPDLDAAPDHAWINRSVRDLAGKVGLSLGSVSDLFTEMKSRAFLIDDGSTKRLINRKKLLDAWVHGYAEFRLSRKRQCFTADTIAWWKKRRPAKEGFRWGGEPAAAILTGHFLRPGKLTIYADRPLYDLVVEANLHTTTDDWTVEMLEPLPGAADGPDPNCVHPLLVYADLIATGDNRNAEAARRIYADHLRRTIESA